MLLCFQFQWQEEKTPFSLVTGAKTGGLLCATPSQALRCPWSPPTHASMETCPPGPSWVHPGQRCGGPWSNEDPMTAHRCPAGLWASPRPGWAADSASCASPTTPDTFSSSRRFKQAALGFRLRSGGVGKERAVGDGPQVGKRGVGLCRGHPSQQQLWVE